MSDIRKGFSDVIYPTMVIRSQAETIELQEKEISRLNNIIDELRKHFEMLKMNCDKRDREFFEDIILYIDKLNELKEK